MLSGSWTMSSLVLMDINSTSIRRSSIVISLFQSKWKSFRSRGKHCKQMKFNKIVNWIASTHLQSVSESLSSRWHHIRMLTNSLVLLSSAQFQFQIKCCNALYLIKCHHLVKPVLNHLFVDNRKNRRRAIVKKKCRFPVASAMSWLISRSWQWLLKLFVQFSEMLSKAKWKGSNRAPKTKEKKLKKNLIYFLWLSRASMIESFVSENSLITTVEFMF